MNQRWPAEVLGAARAAALDEGVTLTAWTLAALEARLEGGGVVPSVSAPAAVSGSVPVVAGVSRGLDPARVAAMARQAALNRSKGL